MAVQNGQKKPEMTKFDEFSKKFWSAFLFTKDGRPKSGFGVYTFCLAFLMAFVYGAGIVGFITLLNAPLGAVCAPWVENLIESVLSGLLGAAITALLHYLFPDKRMMLGTFLWLTALIIAVSITMLIYLSGTGAVKLFFSVFAWFVLIPVGMGLITAILLFRRDYRPKVEPKKEPDYMKYIHRT